MTENELKNYLKRACYADKRIKVLESLINQCRINAQRLSKNGEYTDTAKNSKAENSTEKALLKLVENQQKYSDEIKNLENIKSEIMNLISKLNDSELETVLIHRYILFHTVEETAEIMNYSTRTVIRKIDTAIKKLSLIVTNEM